MTKEELLKKIDFEKNWLYECGIFGSDVDIAFHAIKKSVIEALEQEPKTGHWEMCEDADGIYGVCDICGTDADFTHYGEAYPYCPNCGAKMIESEVDNAK